MKKCIKVFFVGLLVLTANTSVFAQSPPPPPTIPLPPDDSVSRSAMYINIGSIGSGNVFTTIETVRQIIGHAIGNGVVDNFVVFESPIPVEGGLTACAEAPVSHDIPIVEPPIPTESTDVIIPPIPPVPPGPYTTPFEGLVEQLRSIQPEEGVFLNVDFVDSCSISLPVF
jgi:hypothetical protein